MSHDARESLTSTEGVLVGHTTEAPSSEKVRWFLESLVTGGKGVGRIPVDPLPFRVGRRDGLGLKLSSPSISKDHAEIYQDDEGGLRIRDLSSTNGTFVWRRRVEDVVVGDGDIIHFAEVEFRLLREPPEDPRRRVEQQARTLRSNTIADGTLELVEMVHNGAVIPVFQPIVRMADRAIAAYEVLGRGRHPGLPEEPMELFRIATNMGVEPDLSQLFRRKTAEVVRDRPDLPPLFLNSHPMELHQGLIESLEELREQVPKLELTLEIHEAALADPQSIASLKTELDRLRIRLAYDDFGTGQARIVQLAEVPPDFLKFDKSFVRGIDGAPPSKRRLLSSLVAAARDLEVCTVAEGIETEAEARVCVDIGFNYAQGFLFGHGVPIEEI